MAVGFVALWLGQFIYVDWGLTRLHIAARDGRHDAVERILKGGARVDEIDQDGRTALMYAAGNGRLDVVGALLAGGASTVLEDRFGNTAKSYAASHPQIASKLDAAASSVSATSA
jgi:ankyrin repeat protein